MGDEPVPLRIVNATAPIRICDVGGWTDTWFSGHGNVFNIAVRPNVEIQVKVHDKGALENAVVLDTEDSDARFAFEVGALPGRSPLIEAAVADIGLRGDVAVEISISSRAAAGSSTGTSAATAVALIGALDLLRGGRMTPVRVAYAAHRVEVERLGLQSGIQDQLCAVHGGINYMTIPSYPRASVRGIRVPNSVAWELEGRLLLVFLGHAHVSSDMHDLVVERLTRSGEGPSLLGKLRVCAEAARDAVYAADFGALGRAMIENTEAQDALHPGIISKQARAVIEEAAAHGALGWKVNGAGGEGGSITLLTGPDVSSRRALVQALRQMDETLEVIPTSLSRHGLRVWEP